MSEENFSGFAPLMSREEYLALQAKNPPKADPEASALLDAYLANSEGQHVLLCDGVTSIYTPRTRQ